MDLSSIQLPDTATVHLSHPQTGKKLYADDTTSRPMEIVVYGPGSNAAVEHRRKVTREAQQMIAKKGMKGAAMIDAEEAELERLCALTAEVRNLVYRGEVITRENVRKLYADQSAFWVRDQVKERLASLDDFLA